MIHYQKYKKLTINSRFWGGFFLLVALGLFFTIINATPTAAQAGNNGGNSTINLDTSPAIRAQSYTYWKLASKCVTSHMRNTIKTTAGESGSTTPKQSGSPGSDGTSAGEWFADDAAFGYVYPDGKLTCAQILKKAIPLWGWASPTDFLRSIGYKFESSVPQWKSPDNDGNKRFEYFKNAILGKVGNIVNQADDAAMHLLYLNAFKGADPFCQGKKVVKYTDADATQKEWADKNSTKSGLTYTAISVADGDKVVKYIYTYDDEATGQLWRYRGDGWSHDGVVEQYDCSDIAKKITSTSAALADWNDSHTEEQVDAENPSQNTTDPDNPEETTTSCAIDGIGWLVCPVINFLANVADSAFGFLADTFLRTDPSAFNTESNTYKVWQIMRNIANVLFVIAFLIIIFSQLTSVGISNYGVKKMLPRLIVAAILVNVSFFIAQIAIDLSNILGYSIRDVFDGFSKQIRGDTYADIAVPTTTGSFSELGIQILAIAGGGIALYALMSTFGAVILAVVVALLMILFILVTRQVVVVLLVVLSPIAFVALLLPNTEKLFKFWRKTLTAMLLLFPIIALVFGASALASDILQGTFVDAYNGDEQTSNWFGQIVASAVLVLPLFVVPVLLKKSLDGIPVLGQMASRLQGKANANLNRKVGEGYRNSAWGRGRAVRKQARQNYRDRQFASKVVKGGIAGGIAGVAAGGIGKTKSQQYAQQSLERNAIAVADKARNEDISTAAALMVEQHSDPSTQIAKVAGELATAIKNNDTTKARAAQSILLSSGGAGLDQLHKTLSESMSTPDTRNSATGVSLRNALNSAGLKGKDNALASWAYAKDTDDQGNPVDTSLEAVRARSETFSGLSTSELGGQRMKVLQNAIKANPAAITAAQAQAVLNSPEVMKDMDLGKRQFFQDIANGGTQTQAAAAATPAQAAESLTGQQAGAGPTARSTTAPTNVVPSSGGVFAGDSQGVISIEHPQSGTSAGQATQTMNEHGQMGIEGQHEDTIDRMSR